MQQRELPAAIPLPITDTLAAIPLDNAARDPLRPIYLRRTGTGWRDVTAEQFRDEVRAAARGLVARGISPGDPVGVGGPQTEVEQRDAAADVAADVAAVGSEPSA